MSVSVSPLPEHLPLPRWLIALALVAGMLVGAGTLSYTPDGRINLLLTLLLWVLLPLCGSLVSTLSLLRPGHTPWLLKTLPLVHWQLSHAQHWLLWLRLQQLWCLFAIGILLAFLTLLLFSDLAFGWSSTLITDPLRIAQLLALIHWPWHYVWPAAVPSAELIEATRFVRIAPQQTGAQDPGDWWAFLLAALLVWNLLPRLLLILFCQHMRKRAQRLQVTRHQGGGDSLPPSANADPEPGQATLTDWQGARVLSWELPTQTLPPALRPQGDRVLGFGLGDWQREQDQWQALLASHPSRLLWCVDLRRSPLAELGDYIHAARQQGCQQGLLLCTGDTAINPALQQRQMASWHAFAQRHGLQEVVA